MDNINKDSLGVNNFNYRLLFENALEGIAYCKMQFDEGNNPVDFTYIEVNPAFEKLTELKDVVGKTAAEIFPGIKQLHPELFIIYARVALTGKPEKFEINFKPLSKWLSISVYSSEKGYFAAVFEDITDQKMHQAQLDETNSHLNGLNQSMVGRELKMIELKRENQRLKEELAKRV